MATIARRGTRWRVQVRRRGLKPLSKSFESHEEAGRWARQVEGRIAGDEFVDLSEARRTILREALERYLAEVTPGKKGAKQETVRIKAWQRDPLADRPLASIRSMDIAAWRNERVAAGKGADDRQERPHHHQPGLSGGRHRVGHARPAEPRTGRAHAALPSGT